MTISYWGTFVLRSVIRAWVCGQISSFSAEREFIFGFPNCHVRFTFVEKSHRYRTHQLYDWFRTQECAKRILN